MKYKLMIAIFGLALMGNLAAAEENTEEQFHALDTDNDGQVSLVEFKAPALGKSWEDKMEGIFNGLDDNSDGFLSLEEFTA